jgi:hypothetical protein
MGDPAFDPILGNTLGDSTWWTYLWKPPVFTLLGEPTFGDPPSVNPFGALLEGPPLVSRFGNYFVDLFWWTTNWVHHSKTPL